MRYLLCPPITISGQHLPPQCTYLPSDADLSVLFKPDGRFAGVLVVKDDCDAGFVDTCLTAFVDEVLEILCSDCAHVCYSEDKTYCVEDV